MIGFLVSVIVALLSLVAAAISVKLFGAVTPLFGVALGIYTIAGGFACFLHFLASTRSRRVHIGRTLDWAESEYFIDK